MLETKSLSNTIYSNLLLSLAAIVMSGCFVLLPAWGQIDEKPTGSVYLAHPGSSRSALLLAPTQTPADIKQDLPQAIPSPPAVTLPDIGQPIATKMPLSWRAKALAMSAEYPFSEKNSMLWLLPVAYDKGQAMLKKAINQVGLVLSVECPDAGQYLIHTPENGSSVGARNEVRSPDTGWTDENLPVPSPALRQDEIIIVSQPVGDSKTLFKLRIYSGAKTTENKKVYAIPMVMKNMLDNSQLWQ
jgi:hypothetical protein